MIRFTQDEQMLMMIYNPGTREGLIQELTIMQRSLTARDRNLKRWTASVLEKLVAMSEQEYEALELVPDLEEE